MWHVETCEVAVNSVKNSSELPSNKFPFFQPNDCSLAASSDVACEIIVNVGKPKPVLYDAMAEMVDFETMSCGLREASYRPMNGPRSHLIPSKFSGGHALMQIP